ncbi:hypothetical protein RRG08_025679 [Elysia crispata]|uniref:Uncharacterized protein n=1 Tax=Elysia crispata TaxID=231223 RepID=A0AAE1AZC3_9GAST|nr:hypothetical protein RRG08_025679 [Elysia crispata]
MELIALGDKRLTFTGPGRAPKEKSVGGDKQKVKTKIEILLQPVGKTLELWNLCWYEGEFVPQPQLLTYERRG